MTTIHEATPTEITAGTTARWTVSLSDYPAPTYTLTYHLVGENRPEVTQTITAVADGADHDAELLPAASSGYIAGSYRWTAIASDGADEVHVVGDGRIIVNPDPSIADGADRRTFDERMLDAINDALEGRIAARHQSLSIGGKTVAELAPDELERWRSIYRGRVLAARRRNIGASSTITHSLRRVS